MFVLDWIIVIFVAVTFVTFYHSESNLSEKFAFCIWITVLFLVVWGFFSFIIPVEGGQKRISKSEYKVFKDESKVIFSLDDREISSRRHYVYENAEDTSKVYLVREINWNRFGTHLSDYIDIETDRD